MLSKIKIYLAIAGGVLLTLAIAAFKFIRLGGSLERAKNAERREKGVRDAARIRAKNARKSDSEIDKEFGKWERRE
jgi:hypothetical protein